MFWIFVVLACGCIAYKFFQDRNQMLNQQVDIYGGIEKKYKFLVEKLLEEPNSKVVKVARDQIHITIEGNSTQTNFIITENFKKTEIFWVVKMAFLGTHKNKWTFNEDYPQYKMLSEIQDYVVWKTNQIIN